MVQGQAASSARGLSFPVEREKERKKGKRRGRGSISFRVPATFGVHTLRRCQHATPTSYPADRHQLAWDG